ncbi:epoxide hydrolase protein [Rutstroemia sp. NJR-2017a WRK4]|nr:epoxide hydrolase protein [Rutstroemia sp. NJR-2017a WRK4]
MAQTFAIDIPQSKIDLLQKKLHLTTFPDELHPDPGWDQGTPLSAVTRLAGIWKDWDWRRAESDLNKYPQFTTKIDVEEFGELDIHFLHQKSTVEKAIPLLFVHGCTVPPRFLPCITLLIADKEPKGLVLMLNATPGAPSFHVVAPSLPNFGFSSGVKKRGFALAQYAETLHKLMASLGYDQYVTQAGDWGFWITRSIGKLYPRHCKASHLNMVYAQPPSLLVNPIEKVGDMIMPYSEQEKQTVDRKKWFQAESRGYNVLQSTKPQTLAYGLADSPVALLAWLYEKLHDWSDDYPWTDDEILTWVSIYYFSTAGPGAAQRIYYETMHTEGGECTYENLQTWTPGVKLGLAYNPKDLENVPKRWGRTLGEVVYEVENDTGGHFYAHEKPDYLVRDLRVMFGKGGGAFGVVDGCDGY